MLPPQAISASSCCLKAPVTSTNYRSEAVYLEYTKFSLKGDTSTPDGQYYTDTIHEYELLGIDKLYDHKKDIFQNVSSDYERISRTSSQPGSRH